MPNPTRLRTVASIAKTANTSTEGRAAKTGRPAKKAAAPSVKSLRMSEAEADRLLKKLDNLEGKRSRPKSPKPPGQVGAPGFKIRREDVKDVRTGARGELTPTQLWHLEKQIERHRAAHGLSTSGGSSASTTPAAIRMPADEVARSYGEAFRLRAPVEYFPSSMNLVRVDFFQSPSFNDLKTLLQASSSKTYLGAAIDAESGQLCYFATHAKDQSHLDFAKALLGKDRHVTEENLSLPATVGDRVHITPAGQE